jgi:hypothetical protein
VVAATTDLRRWSTNALANFRADLFYPALP